MNTKYQGTLTHKTIAPSGKVVYGKLSTEDQGVKNLVAFRKNEKAFTQLSNCQLATVIEVIGYETQDMWNGQQRDQLIIDQLTTEASTSTSTVESGPQAEQTKANLTQVEPMPSEWRYEEQPPHTRLETRPNGTVLAVRKDGRYTWAQDAETNSWIMDSF